MPYLKLFGLNIFPLFIKSKSLCENIDFSSRKLDFSSRKIDLSLRKLDFSQRKLDFSWRKQTLAQENLILARDIRLQLEKIDFSYRKINISQTIARKIRQQLKIFRGLQDPLNGLGDKFFFEEPYFLSLADMFSKKKMVLKNLCSQSH